MGRKVLNIKDRRRNKIAYDGSDEGGTRTTIERSFLVKPDSSNYEVHEVESAKRFLGVVDYALSLDQVIVTLEKNKPHDYIVRVVTSPLISPIEIFNTKKELIPEVSPFRRKHYATEAYEGVRDVLRKGQYVVHRFINDVVAFEETDKSKSH